jgi:hypothetical protein
LTSAILSFEKKSQGIIGALKSASDDQRPFSKFWVGSDIGHKKGVKSIERVSQVKIM